MNEPLAEGWARGTYETRWHWFIGQQTYCPANDRPSTPRQATAPATERICPICRHKLTARRAGHKEP